MVHDAPGVLRRSTVPPTAITCEKVFSHILEKLLVNLNLHFYAWVCNNNKKIRLNWLNKAKQVGKSKKFAILVTFRAKKSKLFIKFAEIGMKVWKQNGDSWFYTPFAKIQEIHLKQCNFGQ